jgi:hypothetical protein
MTDTEFRPAAICVSRTANLISFIFVLHSLRYPGKH